MPRALALDNSLDPRAKALYLSLIAYKPSSIRELAACASMNRDVTARLVHILISKGWAVVKKYGRGNIIIPTQPPEIQKANLDYIRACERVHPRSGESKMNLRIDQIVDISPFIDNARPWFLQNSKTKELMEYDRFSPEANQAWEFGGRQHYELTPDFPDQENLRAVMERDEEKARLSQEHGITLIHITAEDLTLENMLRKIPDDVPIKLIDTDGIYAKGLEEMCLQYIKYYQRAKARDERRMKHSHS